MAESDGKPASSPLSTEEADALSEKFKPSWETEPEPATIPKVEPPTMPKVEPQTIANVEAPTIPKVEAPNPLAKQTLLGIAAPIPSPPPAAPPNKAPDDLDWELPTNPIPSPIEEAAPAIEPPPKSNPSGIGEKYVPKETGAPAIVLKDEVKRAEERARAELAAEHRARSAPTVLKFKAIEVPKKDVPDELEPSPFGPPKRRLGVWIGLIAGSASVALIGILVAVRGSGREEPTAPPEEIKAAPAESEVPPPAVTPTPAPAPDPKPPEPVVAPSAEAPAIVVAPAKDPEPIPEPPKPAPPSKAPKPVAAAPKAPAPKPQPAPKPASQPGSKPASSPAKAPASKPASGGIVRDAPF